MSEANRAYIATKTVRHVALYSSGHWHALCPRGPEWDYRDDFDSFIWDTDANYADWRWSLPVCLRCVKVVDELVIAAQLAEPAVSS